MNQPQRISEILPNQSAAQKENEIIQRSELSEQQLLNLKRLWIEYADRLVSVTNPREKYEITDSNREIIAGIFYWFLNDPRSCYDLHKGLLIKGTKGTGKTTLLKAFRNFFAAFNQSFRFETAMKITKDYADSGTIEQFCQPRILAIDEMGRETIAKHYGNEMNVIGVILHERYNIWQSTGTPTIATTNMDADEIEAMYGDIIRDRVKEMFNHITLTGESRRK